MGPLDDPVFLALVEQAKRVCPKHPGLLPAYLAAIREKGKGMKGDAVEALLAEVSAGVPEPSSGRRPTDR